MPIDPNKINVKIISWNEWGCRDGQLVKHNPVRWKEKDLAGWFLFQKKFGAKTIPTKCNAITFAAYYVHTKWVDIEDHYYSDLQSHLVCTNFFHTDSELDVGPNQKNCFNTPKVPRL